MAQFFSDIRILFFIQSKTKIVFFNSLESRSNQYQYIDKKICKWSKKEIEKLQKQMKGMIPNIQKLVKIKFIQSSISYFQQSKFILDFL